MPVPAITGRWTSYVVPGEGLGTGPWEHAPNRGFLRSLYALGRAAAAINENDEAERCATFLRDSSPEADIALRGR